ncbi:MAG: ABC transporter ATP-binding protein [Phycisphaerae bacterium]|nr:ABC transporter ATP-binding protein [Phycisphaerae bacterium]
MSSVVTATATTSDSHAHASVGPIRRLLVLFASDRGDIVLVIVFSIAVGILMLATPVTVQALVNFVSFGGLLQPLVVLGILLFGFLALAGAIRTIQAYVIEILQRRLFVRVVADLADRLPRVTAECYDRQNGPELVNRFFDVVTVQKVAAMLLLDGATVLLQAFVGLLVLAFYHPFLLAFDVVLVLSIGFVVFVLGRGAIRTSIQESRAKYAVAAALEELARYPLVFKLAGAADFARRRADALAVHYVQTRSSHFSVVLRQTIGFTTLQVIAATALLSIGGGLVLEGQLTLGQLVAAELIVTSILATFSKLGKQLENVYDLLAAVDKLGHLMDLPLERADGMAEQSRTDAPGLRIIGASFAFEEQKPVFTNFNLDVGPSDRICVVGRHGSGKSVLADLLFGLRRPTKGRIELNGFDVRELSLKILREHVALVRDVETIEGTVEDNVRMGREGVTAEDIRDALNEVGLLDEIRALPDGLLTLLTSTGKPLSSGQTKRLMVARAMVGRPKVLILDDVLDDLDPDARDSVLAAVVRPERKWAVIILGRHDFTSLGVERVVFLDKANPPSVQGQLAGSPG